MNLSASFELDIWGRLRRASESARASLLASQQGRGTVVLTIVTTVASGYIQLRALDRQLEIAQHTSQSLGEAARLQQVRFEEGAVPESDYQQAESQYREAAARVPELERQIAQQENFISVLLGRNPGPIPRGRDIDALLFPAVPGGLPASLLERRPDIRQAEENLIAANADIGVAKAAYFPDISLTGLLGLESAAALGSVQGPLQNLVFGASVLQPIFNAGRISGQVARAEALQQQALYTYEKSIISAFQDVENALIDRTKFGQIREEQAKNVEALLRFRDWPCCVTTKARPSISRSPTPNSRCSTPSSCTSRRSPNSSNRMRICTRRWAAAGSKKRWESLAALPEMKQRPSSVC